MKIFCFFPFYLLSSTTPTYGQECVDTKAELVILQDVSGDWFTDFSVVHPLVADGLEQLNAEYKDIKAAIAHFVDKPNVHTGIGTYGGYPGKFQPDWCYRKFRELMPISDIRFSLAEMISEGIAGSGQDPEEDQIEALMRAAQDASLGWTYSDPQANYKKVAIVVTDSLPHYAEWEGKTLNDYYTQWYVRWICDDQNNLVGGFGAAINDIDPISLWTAHEQEYYEYVALNEDELCWRIPRSRAEVIRYSQLTTILRSIMPYWPRAFSLASFQANPESSCTGAEFPSLKDANSYLQARGMDVVVLVVGAENEDQYFNEVVEGWKLIQDQMPDIRLTLTSTPRSNISAIPSLLYQAVRDLIPPTSCSSH